MRYVMLSLAAVLAFAVYGLPVETPPARAGGPPEMEFGIPERETAPGQIVSVKAATDEADWGHAAIGVPEAWKVTKGKGAVVAVLDTGADHAHRDLKNQILMSKDFTGSRSGDSDVNGHGSHCAGVVAAEANGVGMVGVAPEAKLIIGKVLGDRGSGSDAGIAAGIDWAVRNGADVISMSLGSSGPSARIHDAVKRAAAKGVIVVAAAGNAGPGANTVGYPGGHPECVCVAATDSAGKVASFSSRGPQLTVAAPGVQVKSCYPGDRFAVMSGTSMATPYVAGCAALYVADAKARGVKPTPEGFRKAATETATDLPPSGKDTASGYGIVKPAKFLSAKTPEPKLPDPPAPDSDRIVFDPPEGMPITIGGRKVRRIVWELEPEPK